MPVEIAERPDVEGPEQSALWTLNFGPQHPATHTTLRLIITLDGETVVKAIPDIGYLHSGFEKLGEDHDYNQWLTVVDRMNYISPFYNELAWLNSVEKLMGLELTPRCKVIRTMLGEPPPSILGRSPHSCTPSTSARKSTRFSRPRRGSVSIRPTPASAACSTISTTRSSPRSATSSRASGRSTPISFASLTAIASSSTALRASACCRRRRPST
jgi:hypothetical protein